MRIVFALILLILGGALLGAYLLIENKTLNTQELSQVQTNCLDCHSALLRYGSPGILHDIHSPISCAQCHTDGSLEATDTVHSYLEWIGIGLVGLGLVGIVTNFIIASIKNRAG